MHDPNVKIMARRSYKDPWVKKAKWLTQALIISGTLNVGLLSTFIYFAVSDSDKSLRTQGFTKLSPKDLSEDLGLQTVLTKYSTLSFQDLLLKLGNDSHLESGYAHRDIALACLVAYHHFNLERALGGGVLQKREISFTHGLDNESLALTVFPGLADYQFQAIVQYAKTEKWPLTSQGLFFEIQSTRTPHDPSLLEAFYLTSEFHFISLLFSKTGIGIKKEHLIAMLSQCAWPSISREADHLRQSSEFTIDERRRLLVLFVSEGSKVAAKILLEADQEYCLKQLTNEQVLSICHLLGDMTNRAFLKDLLKSPRSDEIWKQAAATLYDQAAEEIPEVLDLEVAKQRFIELKSVPQKMPLATRGKSTYTVVTGDSLWKIARNQKTTVSALRKANNISGDRLKIGQTLVIP